MATYKTGPGKVAGSAHPGALCPLICEHCFEALGIVRGDSGLTGLSANDAGERWPGIAMAVGAHERLHMPAAGDTEFTHTAAAVC